MSRREEYEKRAEELLAPIVELNGFELVDVEYVKEAGNWYLRGYIDKPGGIAVDDCEAVSRIFSDKLDELDKKYQETVDSASQKTLLFGDRFPFRYMVDDYGLNYYAAFVGCSAESEASFDTISFLANKVDELGLKDIMAIENSNQKIAKTIIENTKEKNQKILTLDTMQSTTSDDVKNGTTYLSVMEKNLEVLKEALQ